MDTQKKEMQEMSDFIVRAFAASKLNMDFSLDSVKHLDTAIDRDVKNGQPKDPTSFFGKHYGQILFGIASYIAFVIIKNTKASNISLDPADKDWYMNFKVVSENTWETQPGQRVIKRVNQGQEYELYGYVSSAVKYFNGPKPENDSTPAIIHEIHVRPDSTEKSGWWTKLFK